ncbi:MAG: efflux RND transporter periplasmic adaptor subunit [Candidatus Brocadiia bacterium]
MTEPTQSSNKSTSNALLRGIKIALGIAAVIAVSVLSFYWLGNPPRAGRRESEEKARLVETRPVTAESHRVTVRAMGLVKPVEEVELTARVHGQLTEVNPNLVPGDHIPEGDTVATVDPSDYRLAVEKARARLRQAEMKVEERKLAAEKAENEVTKARTDLILEEAKQEVAREDLQLLMNPAETGDEEDSVAPRTELDRGFQEMGDLSEEQRELILRNPQVAAARASHKAALLARKEASVAHESAMAAHEEARAALDEAKLNLDWTEVSAPFDALVVTKNVSKGSNVSEGNPVATLVNANRYWVKLSVPMSKLRWIETSSSGSPGSAAAIYHDSAWGKNSHRNGRVLEIEPTVEPDGRMAKVIVEVEDPMCVEPENRGKPRLVLDSYVNARIKGRTVENAVKLSRSELHEGNKAWVMGPDDELEIREVTTAATTPDHVYVTEGLEPGEELIISDISAPVEGMSVQPQTND